MPLSDKCGDGVRARLSLVMSVVTYLKIAALIKLSIALNVVDPTNVDEISP
jgi:hypothetical protein